jgi:hypothetical protein
MNAFISKNRYGIFWAVIVAIVLIVASVGEAQAKSFGSRSSGFSSSRSYSAPARNYTRPAPKAKPVVVKKKTVVNNTTIVQRNYVQPAAPVQSTGSSLLGSFAGSLGGSMLGNWLMSDDEPAPVQQVEEVVQEAPAAVQGVVEEVAQ